jgi:catechol 2,3-dioxygenase-like lactoylglutathione lyase family enzyme
MQLDHLNIYVKDMARSRVFYESILPPFGHVLVRDFGDVAVGFGDSNYAVLALVRDEGTIRSAHLAFRFETRSEVDRLYALALESGATNNGAPGLRPQYHEHYYAAFVLDPDGNNLEFVCHRDVA